MSISALCGMPPGGTRGTLRPPSFDQLDSNSDQSITLDELKAAAPNGPSAARDKRAEALFKAMDSDGNGSVTADEKSAFDDKLQKLMAERQSGLAFMAQQFGIPSNADVFKATDTNSDGAVSFDEFSADDAAKNVSTDKLQQLFGMIDTNSDGSISEDESSTFLDAVRSAVADRGPPPPGGGPAGTGGPPPPPPPQDDQQADQDTNGIDLLLKAVSSYQSQSQTKSTDLISMLKSLLETTA